MAKPAQKPNSRANQGASQFDRALPHNLEAERALLGSILIDNGALNVALETISKDDFFSESHRITFDKMVGMSEKTRTVDLVTLSEELAKEGLLEKVGGAAYLAALTDGVPVGSSAAVTEYARIVKEKVLVRRLINASNNVIARCFEATDDPDTLVDLAQAQIFDIAQQKMQGGFLTVKEIVKSDFGTIDTLMDRGSHVTGVATGFTDLDDITSGLQPGDLALLAARPSLGKTAMALNIAAKVSAQGMKVGVFSLEMTRAALVIRLLCSEARVQLRKLSTGFASQFEWGRLVEALGRLAEAPLYIDDTSSLTVLQLRARARRLIAEKHANLIIVDYLQLLSGGRKFDSRNDEVAYISGQLKGLAKDSKVPVLVLSQLSRESERGRRRKPRLSDLRDSGSLEQDADLVLFLWEGLRGNHDNGSKGTVTTVIVGKQRNGPVGEFKLTFFKPYTRFENYAPGRDDEPEADEHLPYKD